MSVAVDDPANHVGRVVVDLGEGLLRVGAEVHDTAGGAVVLEGLGTEVDLPALVVGKGDEEALLDGAREAGDDKAVRPAAPPVQRVRPADLRGEARQLLPRSARAAARATFALISASNARSITTSPAGASCAARSARCTCSPSDGAAAPRRASLPFLFFSLIRAFHSSRVATSRCWRSARLRAFFESAASCAPAAAGCAAAGRSSRTASSMAARAGDEAAAASERAASSTQASKCQTKRTKSLTTSTSGSCRV